MKLEEEVSSCTAGCFNVGVYRNYQETVLNRRQYPTFRVSGPAELVRGLRICISNNFPADVAGPGSHLENRSWACYTMRSLIFMPNK